MYFGYERQLDSDGMEIRNTTFSVNNVYLNGVRIAAVLPDGQSRYYLTDQVDSVKVVVDDDGLPITRFEYLPCGETWFTEEKTGLEEEHNPKFNSQELDKETGYYFYNARHYDPEIARFVTADNVIDGEMDTQGWNRFSYVKGNPVVYKDPTGHQQKYENDFYNNLAEQSNEVENNLNAKFASDNMNYIFNGEKPPEEKTLIGELQEIVSNKTGKKVNLRKGFHVIMLENNVQNDEDASAQQKKWGSYSQPRGKDLIQGKYFIFNDGELLKSGYATSKSSLVSENKGKNLQANRSYKIHGETGSSDMEDIPWRYMRVFKDSDQLNKYYGNGQKGKHTGAKVPLPGDDVSNALLHPMNPPGYNWSGGKQCQLLEGFNKWSNDNYKNADWEKLQGDYHLIDMNSK